MFDEGIVFERMLSGWGSQCYMTGFYACVFVCDWKMKYNY